VRIGHALLVVQILQKSHRLSRPVAYSSERFDLIKMFFCCSKTVDEVQNKEDTTWRFYRIGVIMEYAEKPTLPPPFIIITHLRLFRCYMKSVYDKRCLNNNNNNNNNTTNLRNSAEISLTFCIYILLLCLSSYVFRRHLRIML